MTTLEIQAALRARGYATPLDGRNGKATKAAIRAFQVDAGLVADGIAGPITQTSLTYPVLGGSGLSLTRDMRMSDKGLLALAIREGVVLTTYRDSVGVLTIGIGHTAAAGDPKPVPGLKVTLAEAIAIFRRDVVHYENDVKAAVRVALSQHAFDACCSFHYNTGGIGRAALTRAINDKNLSATLIEQCFRSWLKPPEVEARRMSECRQFLTGDYGDLRKISVWNDVNSRGNPDPKSLRSVSTAGLLG